MEKPLKQFLAELQSRTRRVDNKQKYSINNKDSNSFNIDFQLEPIRLTSKESSARYMNDFQLHKAIRQKVDKNFGNNNRKRIGAAKVTQNGSAAVPAAAVQNQIGSMANISNTNDEYSTNKITKALYVAGRLRNAEKPVSKINDNLDGDEDAPIVIDDDEELLYGENISKDVETIESINGYLSSSNKENVGNFIANNGNELSYANENISINKDENPELKMAVNGNHISTSTPSALVVVNNSSNTSHQAELTSNDKEISVSEQQNAGKFGSVSENDDTAHTTVPASDDVFSQTLHSTVSMKQSEEEPTDGEREGLSTSALPSNNNINSVNANNISDTATNNESDEDVVITGHRIIAVVPERYVARMMEYLSFSQRSFPDSNYGTVIYIHQLRNLFRFLEVQHLKLFNAFKNLKKIVSMELTLLEMKLEQEMEEMTITNAAVLDSLSRQVEQLKHRKKRKQELSGKVHK